MALVTSLPGPLSVAFRRVAAGTYGLRVEWVAPGDAKRTATQGTVEVYP